jgi:hypothetical protein
MQMQAGTEQQTPNSSQAGIQQQAANSIQARTQLQAHLQELPFPVLVHILKFVPTAHRLSSCAAVCQSWAAAAAAATTNSAISQGSFSADTVQSLSNWLDQHASDVVSIKVPEVSFSNKRKLYNLHPLALPCAQLSKLKSLQLQGCSVQLDCSSSSSTIQQTTAQDVAGPVLLPALRELHFTQCELPVDSLTGMQLSQLTALSFGHWPAVTPHAQREAMQQQQLAILSTLLPRLTQLQFLGVAGIQKHASLSILRQQLESFSLAACHVNFDPCLLRLTTKLTSLQLTGGREDMLFGPAAVPDDGWPQLQRLCLTDMYLNPPALTRLTGLEVLQLSKCDFVSVIWPLDEAATQQISC